MHIFCTRFAQNIRCIFFSVMIMCCGLLHIPLHPMPMGPGMPGLDELTPEQMQQLEQEFQAAAQQIDAYVNSLSPEEQAEFQRAVAEVEQMMSSMSEEELGQFFEQIIAAEMEQAQMQAGEQPSPQPEQPVTFQQKPAPVVSKVPLTAVEEKALVLLTSLIERTDEFLVKTEITQEMGRYFEQWVKSNKLSPIASNISWDQQKNSIKELRQHLSDLKKTDLKTGKYLFLEAFTKNTALYDQLEKLDTQLKIHEPQVAVSVIEKLSSITKNSMQVILSAYGTALQNSKTDIKKLFEEIGPELAKIKEEEKKLTEKAQAESAKGRAITPGRTAGAQPMGDMYGRSGGRGDEYDFGGGGYPYGDYYGPSQGQYGPQGAGKDKKDAGKPAKDRKTPKAGGEEKDKNKEEDKDKDKDKSDKDKKDKSTDKKTDTEQKEKPQEAPIACPVDGGEKLAGKYQLIESNYRYVAELLQDAYNKNLLDFEKAFNKEPNAELVLSILPSIERRLKRLNELVDDYKKQATATLKNDKKTYDAMIDKIINIHTKQKELEQFGSALNQTLEMLGTEGALDTVNTNARYAYLKDKSHDGALKGAVGAEAKKVDLTLIKKEYPENSITSLRDIYAEWERLNTAIAAATPQVSEAPAAPTSKQSVRSVTSTPAPKEQQR